jgi:hypothetical protein
MLHVFLLTLVLLAICIILLGIKVFFFKNGSFPSSHVGENKRLKEKGISCAKIQNLQEQSKKNIFERSNFD